MPGLAGHLNSPVDSTGRLVLVSPGPQTYRMLYRNAATGAHSISFGPFPNNSRGAILDIQHNLPSFRNVTIRHVWLGIESLSTSAPIMFDFVHTTVSSPIPNRNSTIFPVSSDGRGASECVGFTYLNSTIKEEYTYSSTEFNTSTTTGAPVINPPDSLAWIDLLGQKYRQNAEEKLPFMPGSRTFAATTTLSGAASPNDVWAVVVDAGASVPTVRVQAIAIIEFTEE